jgi:hypothetical protein
MRTCVVMAVMLVAAFALPRRADAQVPQASDDPLRRGHALLIGNSHYEDRGWPQLDDIPLQLKQLKEGLEFHFDKVEIAENLKTDKLLETIKRFIKENGNKASDRLFIYYAGHGYTEVIRNENRGYITGIDTPSIDGTAQANDAARIKAIPMLEISTTVKLAPAGHILFVFDSCFAGTIFTNRSGDDPPQSFTPDVVRKLMEKPARDFITAGGANERVPAHSPIPGFFLAALNSDGAADRSKLGVISAADIARYLRDHVLNLPGSNLTPQYGKLPDPEFTEGEFLFRAGKPAIPEPLRFPPTSGLCALYRALGEESLGEAVGACAQAPAPLSNTGAANHLYPSPWATQTTPAAPTPPRSGETVAPDPYAYHQNPSEGTGKQQPEQNLFSGARTGVGKPASADPPPALALCDLWRSMGLDGFYGRDCTPAPASLSNTGAATARSKSPP